MTSDHELMSTNLDFVLMELKQVKAKVMGLKLQGLTFASPGDTSHGLHDLANSVIGDAVQNDTTNE